MNSDTPLPVAFPLTLQQINEDLFQAIHSQHNHPGIAIHAFKFQIGDPLTHGPNGITNKLLLELLLLRFKDKDPTSHALITALLEHLNET